MQKQLVKLLLSYFVNEHAIMHAIMILLDSLWFYDSAECILYCTDK